MEESATTSSMVQDVEGKMAGSDGEDGDKEKTETLGPRLC